MSAGGRREAWRWRADSYYTRQHSIQIIEPAEKPPVREGARVPFGFGIREPEVMVVREPLLWDGDQA